MTYLALFGYVLLVSTSWASPRPKFYPRQSGPVSSPVPTATSKPYNPNGGVGVTAADPPPIYQYYSDFDFQSLNLALNQEWIELDLFHHGLAQFSAEEFEQAGLDAEDRYLIQFMAEQEVGHATMISNMLGPDAAKQCNYTYPFHTVKEFVDFCQKLTRWGESGVYGFLPHLDSRPSAELLLNAITTEARQQLIFRQFEGLFPMPTWFETGITQSMAWTLLAPYITSCPAENPKIVWQNFPGLNITNNPDATNKGQPDISNNLTKPLSAPGRTVHLQWESPGKTVGYNNSFVTNSSASAPKFAAWIAQLNTTYTPLENIKTGVGEGNWTTATTIQPGAPVFPGVKGSIGQVNDTMYILITDSDTFVTPYNLSLIHDHIVAGPAMYQSG